MRLYNIFHHNKAAVCVCVFAASLTLQKIQAQTPTIFYTWEEMGALRAMDDSNNIRMGGRGESEGGPVLAVNQAKFGEGSLEIRDSRTGLTGFPNSEVVADFSSEIKRLTISCWIKPSQGLDMRVLFLSRYAADPKYAGSFKYFWENNIFMFSVQTADDYFVIQSPPVPPIEPGEWTHLAMTFNDGEVTFYFNGEVFGFPEKMPVDAIPAVDMETKRAIFHIASGLPAGSSVDDLAFFGSEALNEKEIHRLYTEGLEAFNNKR